MARPTREARRRSTADQISAGDYIVLVMSAVLFVALLPNWWVHGANINSLKFSQLYFVIMLVLILITLGLLVYPILQSEAHLRPLPFATPPVFLLIGFLMLLGTVYELGRYQGVVPSSVTPGFGLILALIGTIVYLGGAIIKWGSRQRQLV